MEIKEVKNDNDILDCFNIVKQLVCELSNKKEFISIVKRKIKMGYKIFTLVENGKILSFIGVRPYEYFGCGKFLVIDDFVTDKDNRKKGFGNKLFKWVLEYAKNNGYSQIQLDSSIELYNAHKFYIKNGLRISHHHFSIDL